MDAMNTQSYQLGDSPVKSSYTLSSFFAGQTNCYAYAASQAIIESFRHNTYNPLYIYGESGTGKTHLLQAIANGIASKHPAANIRYFQVCDFVDQYIKCMNKREERPFVERLEKSDVFILDDVQFLARRLATQEAVFNIINHLYLAEKQIIVASNCVPQALQALEVGLRERFGRGLIADLRLPSEIDKRDFIEYYFNRGKRLELHADVLKSILNCRTYGEIIGMMINEDFKMNFSKITT
jgi:chromosomal replication initiator protein